MTTTFDIDRVKILRYTWSLWWVVKLYAYGAFSGKTHESLHMATRCVLSVCVYEFVLLYFLSSCCCFAIDDMYRLSLINIFCVHVLNVYTCVCVYVCVLFTSHLGRIQFIPYTYACTQKHYIWARERERTREKWYAHHTIPFQIIMRDGNVCRSCKCTLKYVVWCIAASIWPVKF